MSARILVIDDDADTCRLLGNLLADSGHEVESRLDGRSAVEAFRDRRHDVIITDIRMPGMDGIDVLRTVKEIDPDVGVIIFSAVVEGRTRLAIEALRGGAADYLVKPLSDLGLMERSVEAALRTRATRRESEEHVRELERLARSDALTGLSNRLDLERRLGEEFSRLGRSLEGLSLALFDIDNFKVVNDTHGHQVGDRILIAVAGALREHCRAYDVKARFGGDEFVVVMPDTRLEQGIAVAEKIRRAAAALTVRAAHETVHVTLSSGVTATTAFEGVTPEELVRRADLALYSAKKNGRDRTLPWVLGQSAAQVLIVDANAADAAALVQMCSSLGYRAECAATGAEAVPLARAARHALALVNISLPDMAGTETIRRIRDASPGTSAALLADASPGSGLVLDALSRLPVTLARKPVSIDHLRSLLAGSLSRG